VAQGDQSGFSSAPSDPVDAALAAASNSLARRGYLTTEWWTTIIGGALSAVLALVHVSGSNATHVAAVAAPALLAGLYAFTRTMHKSALATALGAVFPQAAAAQAAQQDGAAASVAPALAAATAAGAAAAAAAEDDAVARTDPDFAFEGIPPIEEASDG
jgi:hypothetical protein